MKNEATGLRRLTAALRYSLHGLRATYSSEAAFRQEVWLALIMIPAALYRADTAIERALLLGSVFLVLIIELLNSAIEAVVDRTGSEYHPLSGKAKDAGSAAVLLGLIQLLVVWGCVLTN